MSAGTKASRDILASTWVALVKALRPVTVPLLVLLWVAAIVVFFYGPDDAKPLAFLLAVGAGVGVGAVLNDRPIR